MTTTVKVTCHNRPVEVVAVDKVYDQKGPTGEVRETVQASLTEGQEFTAHATDSRTIIVRETGEAAA